jgi:hypothetical protein
VPPQRLNATLSADVETVMRRALSKNPANRYDSCLDFVNALASACNGSGKWIPLPRGTSANMPTAGSGEGQGATLGATVAENLAETMAAPLTVPPPPPAERRPLPPTEEMRLPKYQPAPSRQPAAKKPEPPAPIPAVAVAAPTPPVLLAAPVPLAARSQHDLAEGRRRAVSGGGNRHGGILPVARGPITRADTCVDSGPVSGR